MKPLPSQAAFWIGEKNADYGLLITPRFRDGDWENDKSEIRKLKSDYFTVGHVLESGLVVPGKESIRNSKTLMTISGSLRMCLFAKPGRYIKVA